jgi:hypothetical protein
MATISLKNGVARLWRPRAAGALSDGERAHLRAALLRLLDREEDGAVALQLALALARAARVDFPRAWSGLFGELLARGGGAAGALAARRAHLALHHCLKELASKRLAGDQRAFEALASELLPPLAAAWAADAAVLAAGLPAALAPGAQPAAPRAALEVFERWLLRLKALRRLLFHGFPHDARTLVAVDAVAGAAPAMLEALKVLLAQNIAAGDGPGGGGDGAPPASKLARSQLRAMVDRGALKLLKTLRQVQAAHPWSTLHSGALLPALALAAERVAACDAAAAPAPERALVAQCLLLLRQAARCGSYRGSPAALAPGAGAGRAQATALKTLAAEAAPALEAFWLPRRAPLADAIVGRLLPLAPRDLAAWAESPEAFHHAEAAVAGWEDSLRGCAAAALVALVEADRPGLAPRLAARLRAADTACPPGAAAALAAGAGAAAPRAYAPAVLAKEAAYAAAAAAAYELHDSVDFSAWLRGVLLPELADAAPAAAPLRRAAARVAAAWVPRAARADRPPLYAALAAALAAPDAAVALAAAAALRALVDDWEFREDEFEPFAAEVFACLAALLRAAEELETQSELFALLDLAVERLGDAARAHAPALLALLPGVWATGEAHALLRVQVLGTLARLVAALGDESPAAHALVGPALALAADPAGADALNLLEDGLQLWLVALRCAPATTPVLLDPLPLLAAVLARPTEHLPLAARVATSALLLGGPELVRSPAGAALGAALGAAVGDVSERGAAALLPALEAALRVDPERAPAALAPALRALLLSLLTPREARAPTRVTALALAVFARLALGNPTALLALAAEAAPALPSRPPADAVLAAADAGADPGQRALLALIDVWLDAFDAVGAPAARKLSALALAALLGAPLPTAAIAARLPALSAALTGAWCQLEAGAVAGEGADGAAAAYRADFSVALAAAPRDDEVGAAVRSEEAEGEARRRAALAAADPVATLRLAAFARAQLAAAAAAHGAPFAAALASLDPVLAAQLHAMAADGAGAPQ